MVWIPVTGNNWDALCPSRLKGFKHRAKCILKRPNTQTLVRHMGQIVAAAGGHSSLQVLLQQRWGTWLSPSGCPTLLSNEIETLETGNDGNTKTIPSRKYVRDLLFFNL